VWGLREFSLTLAPGVLGLLGPNGAGKSTLMRILATVTRPTDGRVLWDGDDVVARPNRLREVLGYLPQDFGVYPNLDPVEFLEYLAAARGLEPRNARRRIDQLLELVNLTEVRRRPLGGFSGGMRQRVGIAQALLNDPRLLIVDEPTGGLDPEERVRFRNLLDELSGERIVILSTHIVSDVSDLCANMAIINKGEVLLTGDPTTLTAALAGRVWQKAVARSDLESLKAAYPVISTRLVAGRTLVSAVAPAAPGEGFEPVDATLEDVYFAAIAGRLGSAPTPAPALAA